MRPSHKVYVDESGDEGFRFDQGSSRWFVLSGVVFRGDDELSQVKLVNRVREDINSQRGSNKIPDRKPLHFRDLKHKERRYFASVIANAQLRTVSVLIDKAQITSRETFEQGTRLYFYAVRLLLERLSWMCRDDGPASDSLLEVTFSNRSTIEYSKLQNYVEILLSNHEFRGEASVLDVRMIRTETPGRRLGLQIADAVASSYFAAVEPDQYGFTEDGYLRLLAGKAYRWRGEVFGYGVKVFPPEAEREIRRSNLPTYFP
jgi:hypothetical protein